MNWEALGAISEAAGAIAILVSFIYVGIQLRQNTQQAVRSVEANQLAAFERNIESGNRVRELFLLHPELSDLLLSGFKSQSNLTATEKFRFGMLIRNIFSSIQGSYIRHLLVDHDPQEFEGGMHMLDDLLKNPGVQEWLAGHEPDWRLEFRALVDSRLAEIRARSAAAVPSDAADHQ